MIFIVIEVFVVFKIFKIFIGFYRLFMGFYPAEPRRVNLDLWVFIGSYTIHPDRPDLAPLLALVFFVGFYGI